MCCRILLLIAAGYDHRRRFRMTPVMTDPENARWMKDLTAIIAADRVVADIG